MDLPTGSNEKDEIIGTFSSGGMNWGTIAVYSCSVSCEEFREEYVVVQESVDGDPKRMEMKMISNKNGNGNKDLDSDINY
jgi:Programmed cell death protein 2, C-terminal putative domain.